MAKKHAILLGAGLAALLMTKKKRKSASSSSEARDESEPTKVADARDPSSGDGKILVFWAKWCGVCKHVLPKIQEIEKGNTNIKFEYIDIDASPEKAKEYGIKGVPTFVAFSGDREVDRVVGYRDDAVMEELMQAAFSGDQQIKALPAKVHLPVVDFGPDYMTGEIPPSADYRASRLYNWQPIETKGITIVVGPKSCQYCTYAVEPEDGRQAYCERWKTRVAYNYVCNDFEARPDL